MDGVKECALLKTCNRVEIYTVTEEYETTRKKVEEYVNGFIPFNNQENLVQFLTNMDSVKHLLRVSSGLESMIIGEDQIQMQVKESFDLAMHEKCLGPVLSLVFGRASASARRCGPRRASTRDASPSVRPPSNWPNPSWEACRARTSW